MVARAWARLLVPGCDHGGCGCGGDGPSEGLPKSIGCVDSMLVVPATRGRRANSFRSKFKIPRTPDVIADAEDEPTARKPIPESSGG